MTDRKSQGIEATNQAYARYNQVVKKQEYHLAEGRHDEAFDEGYRIRTCDLGRFLRGSDEDKAAFARELGEALHEIGFAILEGHGIDTRLYENAEASVVELFTTFPVEEKLHFRARRHGSVNQGYFPIKETNPQYRRLHAAHQQRPPALHRVSLPRDRALRQEGPGLPHPYHEQVLRRRLRGDGVADLSAR